MKKHHRIKRRGDSYLRDALIIFAITVVSGVLMAIVFQVTMKPIERKTERAKQEAYQAVFEEGETFESNEELMARVDEFETELEEEGDKSNVIDDCSEVLDADGTQLGYVVTVISKEGYGGTIGLAMGVDNDGVVTGMEILNMSETPGLGAQCTEEDFTGQFAGVPAEELTVTTDGKQAENEIDAITGATITSNAVVGAVNAGIELASFLNQ